MKILDQDGNVIESPDTEKGYLVPDQLFVRHHDEVAPQEAVWHYATTNTYENGGRDVEKVIDVPAVNAQAAWDEYEDVLRYIEYTAEEMAVRVRARRKSLLEKCDWTQFMDAPVDAATREAYRSYRQALRDIPEQAGFPMEVVWPELPEITKAAPDPIDTCIVQAYREGVESA